MSSPQSEVVLVDTTKPQRIDRCLKDFFPNYSRTYFQQLIELGLIQLNGELVKKRSLVNKGDEITIIWMPKPHLTLEPEAIPLDILFEDSYLIAINKPPGLVVHPAPGNYTGTFVHALLYHCKELKQDGVRPGIVHRLDKETSGVLIAAKNEQMQAKLSDLFAKREVIKEYRAICLGTPGEKILDLPIGRHPIKRTEMCIDQEKGRSAKTVVHTLNSNEKLSYVQLYPKTGRTHQLRVHLKALGCPILGDKVYGNKSANTHFKAERHLLHAYRLNFIHPETQQKMELKAPIPQDFFKYSIITSK